MAYSDKLKSPKWQKKRLEILSRDNFTCQCCGDTETELHIHHKTYKSGKDPWESNNDDLITICRHCHFVKHEMINNDPDFYSNEDYRIKKVKYNTGYLIIFYVNGITFIGLLDEYENKLQFFTSKEIHNIEVLQLVSFFNENSELYDRVD